MLRDEGSLAYGFRKYGVLQGKAELKDLQRRARESARAEGVAPSHYGELEIHIARLIKCLQNHKHLQNLNENLQNRYKNIVRSSDAAFRLHCAQSTTPRHRRPYTGNRTGTLGARGPGTREERQRGLEKT